MTLKDALVYKDRHDTIRIGARGGSGFVYAGEVGRIDWKDLNAEYADETPFEDREVVEIYPSQLPKHKTMIFIVEGKESGDAFEKVDDKITNYHDEGMAALVAAIYRQVFNELATRYKELAEFDDKFQEVAGDIWRLEKWIKRNGHGFVDDTSFMSRDARKKGYELYKMSQKGSKKDGIKAKRPHRGSV